MVRATDLAWLRRSSALAPRAVGIPATVEHQVLVAVGGHHPATVHLGRVRSAVVLRRNGHIADLRQLRQVVSMSSGSPIPARMRCKERAFATARQGGCL